MTIQDIGKEMVAQDNRCTQDVLFVVQDKKRHYGRAEDLDGWEYNLMAGVFFTARACEAHIRQNAHHYSKYARSYGICARRNQEMQTVMCHLIETAGEEIPSQYSKP
jgi:hypothetical protein